MKNKSVKFNISDIFILFQIYEGVMNSQSRSCLFMITIGVKFVFIS